MKHPLPPLDRLKVFESAARHLSFSTAADELCLSKGAVSYQIRKLEEHIGCQLFRREVRQVLLTDAGQLLQQRTRRCFDDLTDTLTALDRRQHTELVIAATTYVAARWLSRRLAQFTAAYPDIALRFHHNVDSPSFSLRDCDLAVTWGPCQSGDNAGESGIDLRSGNLVSETLRELPMPLIAVASPALLARAGWSDTSKLTVADLQRSPWRDTVLLSEERPEDLWPIWAGHDLSQTRRVIGDANVRVQAAIDGHGWILADDLMLPELQSGQLVSPFNHSLVGYGYRLQQSPTRRSPTARELLHCLLQRPV